jgi:DNA-binding response OmpR family regulator
MLAATAARPAMDQDKSCQPPQSGSTTIRCARADDSKELISYVPEDQQAAGYEAVTALENAGYQVHQMDASRYLLKRILAENSCRLVVFDITQPAGLGFWLCARLRSLWRGPIVIILRGAASVDVMRSFEAGADMYILAPFDPAELVWRVTALLRRSQRANSQQAST